MAGGKMKVFVPGGLQKVIQPGTSSTNAQGTQIAGFAGQILTISQLKTLLGLNNPNTQTPSGGSSGGSGTASIVLGEGLAGGGPLLGTVRINPVSTGQGMFAEDAPDEAIPIPGPTGMRGQQGVQGPPGPAVYLTVDEPSDEFFAVPGPRGPQGAQGPQGNPGTGGSGSAPIVFFYDDPQDDYNVVPGPRGQQGATGPVGPIGLTAPPAYLLTDEASDEVYYFGPAPGSNATGGGAGANPTAKVGLTAVNGSATTFIRSDGAPPIDQAIAPTWTSPHIFGAAATGAAPSIAMESSNPQLDWWDTSAGTNNKRTNAVGTGGNFTIRFLNDAGNASSNFFAVTRGSGAATSNIALGNSTDNPSITATGTVTFNPPASSEAISVSSLNAASSGFQDMIIDRNTAGNPSIAYGGPCFILYEGTGQNAGTSFQQAAGIFAIWKFNNNSPTEVFRIDGSLEMFGHGPNAGALVDMTPDTGTFTGTATGMTTTVTGTVKWSRNGNQVTMVIPALSGTSNSTGFTMTGVPAAIQPATGQVMAAPIGNFQDNSGNANAAVSISGSVVTFGLNGFGGAWTGSGTKTAKAMTVTYLLN